MRYGGWILLFAAACSGDGAPSSADGGAGVDGGARDRDSAIPPGSDGGGSDPDGGTTTPPPSVCEPNRWVVADAPGGGDGSMASPWTLREAMASAVAGDVVEVGPGVYVAPHTPERYEPAFNPANSGEEGNPIVFCARHPAVYTETDRSELRNDATEHNEGSPTFGTLNREHIVWDGFYVNENVSPTTADTGPVVVWGSNYVTLTRCVIEGATIERADNHNGLRLEAVTHVVISDNRIFGVHDSVRANQNHASIMTYNASFVTIEHNEIHDGDLGMYLKGDHEGDGLPNGAYTVRANYVHGMRLQGIKILGVVAVAGPSDVSGNLLVGNGAGFIFTAVGDDHPALVTVHHNTVAASVDTGIAAFPLTMFDIVVRDNLVVGSSFFYTGWDRAAIEQVIGNGFEMDFNYGDPAFDWVVSEADYSHDLAGWQSFSGLDPSSQAGPSPFRGAGDYRLAAGSAALEASSTGGPVGAHLTGDEILGIRPAP
jgi:hypothetical protein